MKTTSPKYKINKRRSLLVRHLAKLLESLAHNLVNGSWIN